MSIFRLSGFAVLALVTLTCGESGAKAGAPRAGAASGSSTQPAVGQPVAATGIPHVPKPSPLRGLYLNRWAALGKKLPQLIGVAEKTEINALVIDVKDDRGFVLYSSNVPLAREIGADTTRPMAHMRPRAYLQ